MRIGIDITVLYVAQAGVFYYRYNLIRAMLELKPPQHDFILVDYFPIHGGWRNPSQVQHLTSPHAETLRIKGLRHRKLSRLWFLQKPGLHAAARGVDQIFLYPWGKLAEKVMARQLGKYLAGLNVFHSSDVLQYEVPGAKTITTIYDLTTLLFPDYHTQGTRSLQERKLRFAQEKADAIIVISDSTKRDLLEQVNVEPERVHVVHAGVDPNFRPLPEDELRPGLAKLGLSPHEYILHVGTIEPRKNLVRLVEAYDMALKSSPGPFPRLVLAGTTGWLFREVFQRIEDLGLDENVVRLGRVADNQLPYLYSGALLFVYPSLYEGFGMPPLEAMACGAPVITSNVSSLPEIVGQAGVLVDPADTSAIAAAITSLLSDGQQRTQLSAAGLERAKLFSWERAAKATVNVYESVAGN